MLNVYEYYDDYQSLPMYDKIAPALALYDNVYSWDHSSRSILEPLEHMIAKQPMTAYRYAAEVMRGRFPDAEPYIMKDPYYAQEYALNIIKGRWEEAEPYIKTSSDYWERYKKEFGIE